MKKILSILICCLLICGFLPIPGNAADFQVTCYYEDVYAGGIVDMYAFTGNNGKEPFTYQWQAEGYGWIDLEDNASYSGTKTDHLQIHTKMGDYGDFGSIPFRCVVTDADGTVRYTSKINTEIYPTSNLVPALRRLGYELYEPTVKGATGLNTNDYENYTAYAYAGTKLEMLCGSTPLQHDDFKNSEVALTRQIHITENGQTTKVGDSTTYIPYTVGTVTVQMKLSLSIAGNDLGDYDTKTIRITTGKPTVTGIAKAKSACSLLRYTYNESQKLASVPKGATVEIVGMDGSYYQVFYNNMVGYIGASLLESPTAGDPVIKNVDVKITAPVAGQKPAMTCQILTTGCGLYRTDPIAWYDQTTGKAIGASDLFQEGHRYSVSIWLAAQSGYKFQTDASGKPKLTGSINGDLMPTINKAYEQDPEQVIEYYFVFANAKPAAPEQDTHTCSPVLVPKVNPTCKEKGQEAYYRCQCGMQYADAAGKQQVNTSSWGVIPATGHTPGNWQIDQLFHKKLCKTCGETVVSEKHYGGSATCVQKAKCTACGYGYGNLDTDHKWSPTYLYKDAKGHAWICADCKKNSEIEPHTPGPAATDNSPQTCKDCGYIIVPAKNHKHKLTKVAAKEATCTEEGNREYYTCDGCSDWFADEAGTQKVADKTTVILKALGHFSDQWKYDENQHWGICKVCNEVIEEGKALHQYEAGKDVCTVCGSQRNTQQPSGTADPAEPADPTQNQPSDEAQPQRDTGKPKTLEWPLLVMIGLVCFGVAITATVIIRKRKKT